MLSIKYHKEHQIQNSNLVAKNRVREALSWKFSSSEVQFETNGLKSRTYRKSTLAPEAGNAKSRALCVSFRVYWGDWGRLKVL